MSAEDTPPVDTEAADSSARRVFAASVNLVGRLGIITVLGAIATLAITRLLGPSAYGSYASAVATSSLLGATADFGFSFLLSRDAGSAAGAHHAMLRAAYEVASAWSLILAVAMVGLAVSAGLSTDRGLVLLVLAPSMIANGLNPARTFYIISHQTRRLVLIDTVTTLAQVAASVSVAAVGLGPIAVGITASVGNIVNSVWVALAVRGVLEPDIGGSFGRRALLRRSAPLGLMAVMSRMYVTIDLVLLGWLVAGPALGNYAAAAKILGVLASIAGTVMSGALPALAGHVADRSQLGALMSRIWHWLTVVVLPVFVAVALFARPMVDLALGTQYRGAVVLIQILAAAGALGVLSNLMGNLMIAFHHNKALLAQNGAAIIVNVAGNLVLVPTYGVSAAAWMTLVTEVIVCGGSLYSLRRAVALGRLVRTGARPVIAMAIAFGVGDALLGSPLLSGASCAVTFALALSALGAWPAEFGLPKWLSAPWRGSSTP